MYQPDFNICGFHCYFVRWHLGAIGLISVSLPPLFSIHQKFAYTAPIGQDWTAGTSLNCHIHSAISILGSNEDTHTDFLH